MTKTTDEIKTTESDIPTTSKKKTAKNTTTKKTTTKKEEMVEIVVFGEDGERIRHEMVKKGTTPFIINEKEQIIVKYDGVPLYHKQFVIRARSYHPAIQSKTNSYQANVDLKEYHIGEILSVTGFGIVRDEECSRYPFVHLDDATLSFDNGTYKKQKCITSLSITGENYMECYDLDFYITLLYTKVDSTSKKSSTNKKSAKDTPEKASCQK